MSLQSKLTEVMESCGVYDEWVGGGDMSPAPASLSTAKNHYCDRFRHGSGAGGLGSGKQ